MSAECRHTPLNRSILERFYQLYCPAKWRIYFVLQALFSRRNLTYPNRSQFCPALRNDIPVHRARQALAKCSIILPWVTPNSPQPWLLCSTNGFTHEQEANQSFQS